MLKIASLVPIVLVILILAISGVLLQENREKLRKFSRRKGVVVANGIECAEVGTNILSKGGNIVEAAIATLFCDGVFKPQSCGLGGGFMMTIYNRTARETYTLNSREVAPRAANRHMYDKLASDAVRLGGLPVAVPGELKGYWVLYQNFGGRIPWRELVQPSIDFCYSGIYVDKYMETKLEAQKKLIYADRVMRSEFWDSETNDTYKEGQYIYRPTLAKTLEIIAEEGGLALHNGSLTESFVRDIQNAGGIITVEDMNNYNPEWLEPIQAKIKGLTIHTMSAPAGGSVLLYILSILEDFLWNLDPSSVTATQRITEAIKFGHGAKTHLGDPNFYDEKQRKFETRMISKEFAKRAQSKIDDSSTSSDPRYYDADTSPPNDHGTAALLFLAENGDAISVTTTINNIFGAGFMSESTGIVPNDQMGDFHIPDVAGDSGLGYYPNNLIAPGKRPLSSACPTIIVDDNGDVEMVIGAAGGKKIIPSVAITIIRNLWFGMSLQEAINEKRFNHPLFPMELQLEEGYFQEEYLLERLKEIGHNCTVSRGLAAVSAIRRHPYLTGNTDVTRRSGYVAYIEN